MYDGFPYPYGFGVGTDGSLTPVLDEGAALVQMLHQQYGLDLVNITIGNPYVNRPYDMGGYIPKEHPLEGVARMMHCVGQIQKNNPELVVIGSAFSYLRNLSPNLAAGAVKSGTCPSTRRPGKPCRRKHKMECCALNFACPQWEQTLQFVHILLYFLNDSLIRNDEETKITEKE